LEVHWAWILHSIGDLSWPLEGTTSGLRLAILGTDLVIAGWMKSMRGVFILDMRLHDHNISLTLLNVLLLIGRSHAKADEAATLRNFPAIAISISAKHHAHCALGLLILDILISS